MVSFGRDLIAEKNKRESIKSSVIKYWNVNYFDPNDVARQKEEARMREAQEVYDRLAREKADDEAKKQTEIDQAYIEAANYNATTGSYSGAYGQGNVDSVTQDQVQMILNEKNAAIQGIIDAGNGN